MIGANGRVVHDPVQYAALARRWSRAYLIRSKTTCAVMLPCDNGHSGMHRRLGDGACSYCTPGCLLPMQEA